MAADFSKPTTNSTKLGFPQEIVDNDQELAVMHDGGGASSNKPTNTKRIDNSTGEVFNWNGSSWVSIGFISLTRDPVGDITDGAPAALDTLNELAAALADDANFASTVTTSLDTKMVKSQNLNDVSDKASSRNNLDVYSKGELYTQSQLYTKTEVDALISSVGSIGPLIYVASSATGDGSGSNSANRMVATSVRSEIDKYVNSRFSFNGEDYQSILGTYAVFGRDPIIGRNIEIQLEGDCNFGGLFLTQSNMLLYKLDNSLYYTADFNSLYLSEHSNLTTERTDVTLDYPQNTKKINLDTGNLFIRHSSSVRFVDCDTASLCSSILLRDCSHFFTEGGLTVSGTTTGSFEVTRCSSLLSSGVITKTTGAGTVSFNSTCEASSYSGTTPTASNGGVVV